MVMARVWGLLAIAIALSAFAGFAPAADDDKLKEQALKLNDLATPEKMQEKLVALNKDKEGTKALIKAALKAHEAAPDKEKPYKFPASIILAKAAHILKEYDAAETFYKSAVATSTARKEGLRHVQAYEGLLDVYWDQKEFSKVEEVAQRFIEIRGADEVEQAKPFILEQIVKAKAKQGNSAEALQMADNLIKLDDGGWYFLQLKGWVQREGGKLDDAISTYEEVLEKISKSKQLKDEVKTRISRNVRYLLSGLHVDNKAIDKAAEQLQKLIKDDPENPTFYNDLGFIWSDNNIKLDESEAMIRKALELDAKQRQKLLEEKKIDEAEAKKENAAYLDSLGWVLFKNKKYEEAVKYLEAATKDEDEGQHIEIWDHLADALVALGKKKEAVEIWQKCLKLEDVSSRDSERRKKVTEKLRKMKAELAKS